jgi:hypothetical protein
MTEDIVFTPYPDTGLWGTIKDFAHLVRGMGLHQNLHNIKHALYQLGLEIVCVTVGHKTTAKVIDTNRTAGFICERCYALFGGIQFKQYAGPEFQGPGEWFSQTMARTHAERNPMKARE